MNQKGTAMRLYAYNWLGDGTTTKRFAKRSSISRNMSGCRLRSFSERRRRRTALFVPIFAAL